MIKNLKKTHYAVAVFTGFLMMASWWRTTEAQSPADLKDTKQEKNARNVQPLGFIELVADPYKFDNQLVVIKGYWKCEFESCALFMFSGLAEKRLSQDAIWLEFRSEGEFEAVKQMSGSYVTITGYVKAPMKGHLGAYATQILVKTVKQL
ncbi:MAG: hypothetical protein ACKV19_09440 [Verrucomicrobiales bacterium]